MINVLIMLVALSMLASWVARHSMEAALTLFSWIVESKSRREVVAACALFLIV